MFILDVTILINFERSERLRLMTNGNVKILDCSNFLLRYNVYTSLGRLVTSVWKNGAYSVSYSAIIVARSEGEALHK